MEMKTLQDIESCTQCLRGKNKESHACVDYELLKQEGIKHYKKYFNEALHANDKNTEQFCLGHCAMIEEFCDLREEDLK